MRCGILMLLVFIAAIASLLEVDPVAIKPISAPDYVNAMVLVDLDDVWKVRSTIGLSEHAARLGAPSMFERRGQTIFQDTFSYGIGGWGGSGFGVGGAISLDAARSVYGGYALKIASGTGVDPSWYMARSQPWMGAFSLMGFEAHISSDADAIAFRIRFTIYTGGDLATYEIEVNTDDDTVYYLDAAGNLVDTGETVAIGYGATLFNAIKLVVDPLAYKYDRVYINHKEIDLSAFTPYRFASGIIAPTSLRVGAVGDGVTSGNIWVDRVIYTENEPEE